MRENGLKTIAMLGIIIGAVGLGFGAFATWQVQRGGADGDDGDDGDDGITTTIITYDNVIEYPCSSEAAINNALTAIGTGYGIITITDDITLSGTIDINGGGNYIIQSAGAIIKCISGLTAFHITNVKSLSIQNIQIDATAINLVAYNIIWIDEASDNPIYIKNVQLIGDDNTKGTGIRIDSDNVWVSDCYFHELKNGVYQLFAQKAHVYNNEIDNCSTFSVYLTGVQNFIVGNLIKYSGIGIYSDWDSHYNIISNNIIYNFSIEGIRVYSNYTTVVGNNIGNDTLTTANPMGIYLDGGYNTIDANGCYNIKGTAKGYGIYISNAAHNNTVVGNTCLFNDDPFEDNGINTYLSGNQFF